MKTVLITGGCGFLGRNLVRRLINSNQNNVIIVDDLSAGIHPDHWINVKKTAKLPGLEVYGDGKIVFIKEDIRIVLQDILASTKNFSSKYEISGDKIDDVYHFAAIVGGRAMIENESMALARNLSIDSELFYWASIYKPERILYPSSSAAYPVHLQTVNNNVPLKEEDIDLDSIRAPDLLYGWSKINGEYLSRLAVEKYNLKVTCVRPFSGYGEDQNPSYPIPAICQRFARKENPIVVWGTGQQGRDFVHVEDVLDCVEIAMGKLQNSQPVNIGSGVLTSFLEVISTLSEIAGYDPKIVPLVEKPIGVHSRVANNQKAQDLLDWSPKIDLREGLYRVYKATKKNL